MQHAQPQQLETCSAIHLTLEELEAIDLPLDLSAAPRRRERGPYRVEVGPQTCRKAAHLRYNAVSRSLQPLIKSRQIAAVNQAEKVAGETSTNGNGWFDPLERLDEALVIAELALRGMPSMPADKPGIGAAWGRTQHLRHTSCRSHARRGRTIPCHRAADCADAASEPT
jgi:hypothetical protein